MKYIFEHLKTRKKYNTLMIKYDVKCEELEQKIIELNAQKKINKIEREKFEKTIEELTQKIMQKKKKEKNKNENNKCKCK